MDLEPIGRPRVAFFGGSFDPPHLGHLEVARAAQAALGLDTVLFAPVGEQPLKPHGSTASFAHRLAMTRLAIAGDPAFAVSLADAPKPSGAPNFTFDTLLALRAQLPPDGVLFCLMGADAFALLRRWHRAAEIPFVAPLIVASRPGEQLDDLKPFLPDGLTMVCQGLSPDIVQTQDTRALAPEVRSSSDSQIDLRRHILRNPSGHQSPFYLLPGLDIEISASQIRGQLRNHAPVDSDTQTPLPAQLPATVSEYIRAHGLYGMSPD
jgi:nicotinate-nucleotide adenylyltransferase